MRQASNLAEEGRFTILPFLSYREWPTVFLCCSMLKTHQVCLDKLSRFVIEAINV